MNTLKTNSKINNINDSVMVLVDGQYKGQTMTIEVLAKLLECTEKSVTWTRKVLVSGKIVEKEMDFDTDYLREFALNSVNDGVFNQISTGKMVQLLRK